MAPRKTKITATPEHIAAELRATPPEERGGKWRALTSKEKELAKNAVERFAPGEGEKFVEAVDEAAKHGRVYVESSPEKVTPAPAERPFGELSIDEKLALHRAYYEGKPMELYLGGDIGWHNCVRPAWNDAQPYRVKPEPEMPEIDGEFVVDVLMGLLTQYEDDGIPLTDVDGNDTGKTMKLKFGRKAGQIDIILDGRWFAVTVLEPNKR